MKNQRLHWIASARAALTLLTAVLAFATAMPCHASAGEDAGELATLFARISKAALLAGRGNPAGFAQLRESSAAFTARLQALRSGSHYGICTPTGLSAAAKARLDNVAEGWSRFEPVAGTILQNEETMGRIAVAVRQINGSEKALTELAEQVAILKLQNQRGLREIALSHRLVFLQMRLTRNANALLADDTTDPEIAFLLGKDTNSFRDIAKGMQLGSPALGVQASEGDELAKLTELSTAFQADLQASAAITGNLRNLVMVKSAARLLSEGGEALFRAVIDLQKQIDASSIC